MVFSLDLDQLPLNSLRKDPAYRVMPYIGRDHVCMPNFGRCLRVRPEVPKSGRAPHTSLILLDLAKIASMVLEMSL